MEKCKEDDIREILLEALLTDGGHHKQYALEEALRLLIGNTMVNKLKDELQWEDGIPS